MLASVSLSDLLEEMGDVCGEPQLEEGGEGNEGLARITTMEEEEEEEGISRSISISRICVESGESGKRRAR